MADETGRSRAFFGRRKGHPLRAQQAALFETLLPRLAIDLTASPPAPASLFPDLVDDVRLEIGFGGGEHLMRRGVHVHGRGSVVILLITLWSHLLANHADALVLGAGMLRGTSRQPAPVNAAGGAGRTRTISQDIMPDRAAGVYAPAAVASSSFTHRIDRPSENTTCQTRLRHDVVFLRRREGRVTEQVFDTFHIAGILTRPEAGRCMTESV